MRRIIRYHGRLIRRDKTGRIIGNISLERYHAGKRAWQTKRFREGARQVGSGVLGLMPVVDKVQSAFQIAGGANKMWRARGRRWRASAKNSNTKDEERSVDKGVEGSERAGGERIKWWKGQGVRGARVTGGAGRGAEGFRGSRAQGFRG